MVYMNFVALIGIVDKIEKDNNLNTKIVIKVESQYENQWDYINILVDDEKFKSEVEKMSEGDIIGVKGRINDNYINCERLQIF